ncbi:unnamed protein product [Toxocara canis]|uniref:DUF2012 domain-containing protein n=1 Tax=Toxocara canis TaxID=6265 RepID=A0A183UWD9_TOXCA|nr:unnamed protein product [Toxocara canis]
MQWCVLLALPLLSWSTAIAEENDTPLTYSIEGQAILPPTVNVKSDWHTGARVLVNYGQHIAFVKLVLASQDIQRRSSYIVEVSHVNFVFEPVRVDITSKGKFRARRLNLLQPSIVSTLPYPLRLTTVHQISYFRAREEWRLIDMLSNPMVLMMVVPLLLLVVLPKLVNTNDPEVKKEMAKSMPQMDVPDFSDMLASWLGGTKKPTKKPTSSSKKRI